MFSDPSFYRYFIALDIIAILVWIVWLFWRFVREAAILKNDFYRAHWRIGLFWLLLLALAGVLVWLGYFRGE